eukprot:1148457-Pelagomonas_calceolata.AAC.1
MAQCVLSMPTMYANKLITTRRAIENNDTSHSQVMESALWCRGLTALLSQCVSFSSIGVGRVSSVYVVFLFLFFVLGVC